MKKLFSLLAFSLLIASTSAFAANPVVEMQTSAGMIRIELYPEKAPKTVENFLQYVKDDFYSGTIFHRVIPNFMIQGGGFNADMKQKTPRDSIPNEANNGLKNLRGTIAMARRGDPNSANSQFFINHVDNSNLDYQNPNNFGYAVFGKVTQGLDVVDTIANVPRGNHPAGFQDVPKTPIVIKSAKIIQP